MQLVFICVQSQAWYNLSAIILFGSNLDAIGAIVPIIKAARIKADHIR